MSDLSRTPVSGWPMGLAMPTLKVKLTSTVAVRPTVMLEAKATSMAALAWTASILACSTSPEDA